jgi:PAS domain S-box-containing protein
VAQSRAAAEQQAAQLAGFVAAVPSPLALFDREGRAVRVNEAFAAVTGLPADAQEGCTAEDILPGAAGPQVAGALRAALASGRAVELDVVGETRAAPGTTRRLSTTAFPVRAEGAVVGVGLAVRDAR